ncbi:MAG TPA: response regulator [Candidatus Binatia bacterium]|jgi:two-component system probable response regulator PhcQ
MEPLTGHEKCTILYVDDEEKSLKYFARAFGGKFNILSAANASDGYRLLEEHRDEIGLLITDQRMPGEKGVDFLQRARQLHPHAIRILTTAYSDFDVAIEAVNSAAIYKYVTKPWDIPELEAILDQACQVFTQQRDQDHEVEAKLAEQEPPAPTEHGAKFGDLKTPEQIARYLNINKFTVYRLVTEKKIPAFKVGNQWRFKQEMIDAWMMAKSNIGKKKTN